MIEKDVTALTIATAALAAQLWGSALPARSEVASAPPSPAHVAGVRSQCLQTGGAALVVGAAASLACHSWYPFLGAAAVVAYLAGTYSSASRHGHYEPTGGAWTGVPR